MAVPCHSFGLGAVESYWPRRLLRVTDFTSLPISARGDKVFYDHTARPRYNIISYTWGRYVAKPDQNGTAIDIRGLPWPVPRIHYDPSAPESTGTGFIGDQFKQVLGKIGQDTQFVWVDVACIPQKGSSGLTPELQQEADDEIGHQAGIFERANQAYVWLHQMSTDRLSQAVEGLRRRDWDVAKDLFSDPWFTSLWTLQEGYLRKDAILLSCEGDNIISPRDRSPITLGKLMSLTDDLVHRGQSIFYDRFRYAGIETLLSENPLVLLGVVPHRKVTEDPDKVCGIMQIFGLKLDRSLGLDELRSEFAKQIICKSPVVSQAFTHAIEGAIPSWRIPIPSPAKYSSHEGSDQQGVDSVKLSNSSVSIGISYEESGGRPQAPYDHTKLVPKEFYNMVELPWEGRAQISFDEHGDMVFEGRLIKLKYVQTLLRESDPAVRLGTDNRHTEWLQETHGEFVNSCRCSVYLDKSSNDGFNPYMAMARDPLNQMPANPLTEIDRLVKKHPHGYVFVLGKFQSRNEVAYLGILVGQFKKEGTRVTRRYGFCTWSVELNDEEWIYRRVTIQ
ncbi:hypothetical protein PG999_001286 [Apiospora kogelbergensis]|uniref:Heterokaryon incompatibility domain-containing protein n=1 Tax=Apiospora kogelbergensis TaxID=1337665 RepID=A0AAW0RE35_9PEZI